MTSCMQAGHAPVENETVREMREVRERALRTKRTDGGSRRSKRTLTPTSPVNTHGRCRVSVTGPDKELIATGKAGDDLEATVQWPGDEALKSTKRQDGNGRRESNVRRFSISPTMTIGSPWTNLNQQQCQIRATQRPRTMTQRGHRGACGSTQELPRIGAALQDPPAPVPLQRRAGAQSAQQRAVVIQRRRYPQTGAAGG
jgi:hypothetical protein